nr:hypothetical protein [Tanacetum cinerariifolium]
MKLTLQLRSVALNFPMRQQRYPAGSIVSTGGVPAGSIPASSVPAGSVPVSSVPTSNVPAGGVLAGSIDSAGF